ncbi:organic hydroperoxide resistance protein [Mongoliitalea daihaiensis]|uniref:organic hydroperoxide resistance protein n=1 Tax=Mongoliitalea daihaiensis TaxID=2782006 RepID=UPI001F33E413|nr:organic hydroperoxide resistance protein [Mongoliitalea daihaiensis]UJP63356.1 organic hydroperoxide resistance protein [Mongoliitalea daihaiensis]
MQKLYETSATAVGGRNGSVKSSDGVLELDVRLPKVFGGQGGSYTNPEQLFAAGYAACFDNALNFIAKSQRLAISSKVTAHVALIQGTPTAWDLAVTLDVEINGLEESEAQKLMEQAHDSCPYSRAIQGNVQVTLNLK